MTRLRLVLPPDYVLITFVLMYAATEGPYLYLEWKIQQPLDVPRASLLLLRFLAFVYGAWRVAAFHPAHRPDYCGWLERTPWTYRSPLPGGPIALSWEDLPLVGAFVILSSFHGALGPFFMLDLILIGYLFGLLLTMWRTGAGSFGYAIAFGIGLALRCWPDPRISLIVLLATYAVAQAGLRVSLSKFPWMIDRSVFFGTQVTKNVENNCGWPFDQLHPA